MKNFLNKMLSDKDGQTSSKRIITICAFILILIGFFSNLYFNYAVEEFIFQSIMCIVLFGLGATASEKFTNQNRIK